MSFKRLIRRFEPEASPKGGTGLFSQPTRRLTGIGWLLNITGIDRYMPTLRFTFIRWTFVLLAAILAGCQTGGQPDNQARLAGTGSPSADRKQPSYDPTIAFLKLSQIKPQPGPPASGTGEDETSQRALKQIEAALELFEEDRYTEAIQRLERALRYSPNSLQAHRLMARICLQAGNTARARGHLDKTRQINPDSAEIQYLLGKAFALDGAWQEALTELRTVFLCSDLHQHPAIAVLTHYHLAGTLDRLGYLSAAADEYQAFIDAVGQPWPEDTHSTHLKSEAHDSLLSAYIGQSKLYARLGKPQRAASVLEQASTYAPKNEDLLHDMAVLYLQAKRYDVAAEAARRLISMDERGLSLLISIRREAGQEDALIDDLTQMISANPDDYLIVAALVDSYREQDRIATATQILRDFVSAHPGHSRACVALSNMLLRQEEWEKSLKVLSRAIRSAADPETIVPIWLTRLRDADQLEKSLDRLALRLDQPNPDFAQAYVIGRLAQQLDHDELAEKAFLIGVRESPAFALSIRALCQVYLDDYRWDQAVATVQQAIELDKTDAEAYRLLGDAYLGLDDYDQAAEALSHALRLDRTDLPAMLALTQAYELSGKVLQRKRHFQMIIEIDPSHAKALEVLFLYALEEQNREAANQYLSSLKQVKGETARYRRCQARLQVLQDGDKEHYFSTLKSLVEDNPADIETRIRLVQDYLVTGEYESLRGLLSEILKVQPDHSEAIYWQSMLQMRDLSFDPAVEGLQQLLIKHPNRIPWQQALVAALVNDQRLDSAADLLVTYLANPNLGGRNRLKFQYELVLSHVLAERSEEAINCVKEWIADDQEDYVLKSMQIDLCRLTGEYAVAVKLAESWHAEVSPENQKAARALLLEAYSAAGRFDDAEVLLLDWLEIDPDAVDASYGLMSTFVKAENIGDAIEMTRAAIPEADDTLKYIYIRYLHRLYELSEDLDQAIRLVREHMGLVQEQLHAAIKDQIPSTAVFEGRAVDLRDRLCRLLIKAEQYDEAERELTAWKREDPGRLAQAGILRLRSLCYQLNGKESLAIQQLEELYKLDPEDSGINNDLGYTWANQGMNLDQAEQMIRKAVGVNSRTAAYLDSLGWVLYKKGDFAGADKWLSRASHAPSFDREAPTWSTWLSGPNHKRGGDDPVINDHLGDTAWRLGKKSEAIEYWRRAHQRALEETDSLQLEYKLIAQKVPAKIEAAQQGDQPEIAPAATD